MPVAVIPTEMDLSYDDHQIFDYRKKYLASRQVTYHCPPRFENEVIEKIQIQAEQLFNLLGMQDFARFDGWLLKSGEIWFSDFNPISGMEQNSFLFMQAARIGMSHGDVLRYILKSACRRYTISLGRKEGKSKGKGEARERVNVLFGGDTAERQVSVMSGTNVWLKLKKSEKFKPTPYLLDADQNVWKIPYALGLNHTVEEITESCVTAQNDEARLHDLVRRVTTKLSVEASELSEPWFAPQKMTLSQFLNQSDFVFIGLHGGIGEDGRLQKKLEDAKIPFNGSGSKASQLCMNKYETGQALKGLEKKGIHSAHKKIEKLTHFEGWSSLDFKRYWKVVVQDLGSKTLIVKPIEDGCSAGIARLFSAEDLKNYLNHAKKASSFIPQNSLHDQPNAIEMPTQKMNQVMLEQFITTDKIRVTGKELKWQERTNWIEVTMGVVMGGKNISSSQAHAMSPSLTIADGNVLSLEEKFQGGTGINITPPPQPHVKKSAIQKAKKHMELVAKKLGIQGYARIDAFMHRHTGELIIIEANSTPALTPSTVIYHQALEEKPAQYPTEFLEKLIESGRQRYA